MCSLTTPRVGYLVLLGHLGWASWLEAPPTIRRQLNLTPYDSAIFPHPLSVSRLGVGLCRARPERFLDTLTLKLTLYLVSFWGVLVRVEARTEVLQTCGRMIRFPAASSPQTAAVRRLRVVCYGASPLFVVYLRCIPLVLTIDVMF